MVEKNTCINCGKVIEDIHKRKCVDCSKKKEKHLSNHDILNRYSRSLNVIDNSFENLKDKINTQLFNLKNLKQKYMIVEDNNKLLDILIKNLLDFKEKLPLLKNEFLDYEKAIQANSKIFGEIK